MSERYMKRDKGTVALSFGISSTSLNIWYCRKLPHRSNASTRIVEKISLLVSCATVAPIMC